MLIDRLIVGCDEQEKQRRIEVNKRLTARFSNTPKHNASALPVPATRQQTEKIRKFEVKQNIVMDDQLDSPF
jgi:hypothetical protein